MANFDNLNKAKDTLLDAEWAFKQEVANILRGIAEEKGTDVFPLEATIDDPRNMEGGAMDIVQAELWGDDSVEFTTDNGEVYYIDDLDPDAVIFLIDRILVEVNNTKD